MIDPMTNERLTTLKAKATGGLQSHQTQELIAEVERLTAQFAELEATLNPSPYALPDPAPDDLPPTFEQRQVEALERIAAALEQMRVPFGGDFLKLDTGIQ